MVILNGRLNCFVSKNTHITVVSTDGMIARELRNATDQYIDLNDLRQEIEKSEF